MEWKSLIDVFQIISAIFSIFLNTILTVLIFTKSPKQLGSYKRLMLIISWFEIIYSIMDVVVSPVVFSTGSIFVVISNPKYDLLPKSVLLILVAAWCGFFGFSMGMFALHFIYRYLVASGSSYLPTFDGYGLVFWMLIPIIYGSVWGMISYFPLQPTALVSRVMRYPVLKTFDWDIDQIAYDGPYFYQKQSDGSVQTDYPSFVSIIVLCLILISSISAMSFCGYQCFLRINSLVRIRKDVRSQKFDKLQSQLFYALITQTLIPVILMHFPVIILFITTLMGNGLGSITGLISITISLFPALDPLPTMFIIKNYRSAILEKLRMLILKKKSNQPENNDLSVLYLKAKQTRPNERHQSDLKFITFI